MMMRYVFLKACWLLHLALVDDDDHDERCADDDPNRTPTANNRRRSGSLLIGLLKGARRSGADVAAMTMARDGLRVSCPGCMRCWLLERKLYI